MDHARTIVGSWSNRFFLAEAIGDVFSQILTSGGQAVFFVADAVFGALLESGVRRLRNRGRAVFVKRDGFVAISFSKTSFAFFGCAWLCHSGLHFTLCRLSVRVNFVACAALSECFPCLILLEKHSADRIL